MAKYCIHCGRKLEDGEVCTCQIKQQEERKNDFLDIDNIYIKIPTPFKKGDILATWDYVPYRKRN